MADIKSSLEIALERAAAIGGGREDLLREQGEKAGRALGRRALAGELAPGELAAGLQGLDTDTRPYARRTAARTLVDGLPEAPEAAVAALAGLAEPGDPDLGRLRAALDELGRGRAELEATLAAELGEGLAQAGIGGSAVRANPKAHPDYERRAGQALDPAGRDVERAGRELLAALE